MSHKFWNTQPVIQNSDEDIIEIGPIQIKKLSDIKQNPYQLIEGFYWKSMDIENDIDEIHKLLYNNYVEDDDNQFRLNYTKDFLKWAMTPPGYFSDWHVGLRLKTKNNDKLVGFISGIPIKLITNDKKTLMCEINFLCCHKKLRGKRMAPILIKEITRRVNLNDIWQAIYTIGYDIPTKFSTSTYYHRIINLQKFYDINYYPKPKNNMLKRTFKLFDIPANSIIGNIRNLTIDDVPEVTKLLNEYLNKYIIHQEFTEKDILHWFIGNDIINSFIVENDNKITDFCSYYALDSKNLEQKNCFIKTCYLFYYFNNKNTLKDLVNKMLLEAKNHNFDIFNMTNIMDNSSIIDELKFKKGSGKLNYYFYNWKMPKIDSDKIGFAMI